MSSIPTTGWKNELKVSEDQCGSISNQNAKRILAFLKEGEKRLDSNIPLNDVILLVGNTGSGKTTLSQFLTNDDLVSYEVGEESGEFLIYHKDDDKDADSTVVSKTTYPRVFVDPKTGDIYVDVGGFNDTGRNEVFDIASAYFTKRVIGLAQNIKIVMTADHSSLRKGVNRYDFRLLLQHMCVLLKDIEKYRDGLALIATKVDNNGNLISDAAIIKNMASFLTDVQTSVRDLQKSEQICNTKFSQKQNKSFVQKATLLIDILLQRNDNGEFSRLGIFRRPNAPGLISDNQLLQENKAKLKSMMKNNLKFVPLNLVDDIGYAISSGTKNIIWDLADEIHQNVKYDLNQFLKEVIADCVDKMSRLSDDKNALKNHLAECSEGLAEIQSCSKNCSLENLVCLIRENLIDSCKRVVHSYLVDIENLDKFLKFIGELACRTFDFGVKNWIRLLEAVVAFVVNALATVSEAVKQSAFSFFDWVKALLHSFKEKVQDIFRRMIECLNSL